MNLRQHVNEAEKKKIAIGHFNVSDTNGLWAVFNAARKLELPVIIGVSEGERKFIGVRQIVALVKSLRDEHQYPIFLNADHTYSFEGVEEAIDAGFDAVIFDGAKLPLEENVVLARKCVEYAKSRNPEILVEGELGYIGTSSMLLEKIPEGAAVDSEMLTKPEIAEQFVEQTGISMLAPAVGNLHGMLKGMSNPEIDSERIKEIRQRSGVPLVLHGGSGITATDFTKAIEAGISIIHINTEIRLAYRQSLKLSLQDNSDEVAPYKFLKPSVAAMEKVVTERLKLFNNIT